MTYRPSRLIMALAFLAAAFLILPSLMAVPASFTDRAYLSLPDKALSLQHYVRFLNDQSWANAFLLSLGTSFVAACISTMVGTAFSLGVWGLVPAAATLLRTAVLLPLAVPGIIAALALFLVWISLGMYDTVHGVILVQIIVGMPFVVVTTTAALAAFDLRLLRAARSMGAGAFRTLFSVVLPNIRTSIFAGFVLSMVTGWDESVISLFITGFSVQTLPRKIWDGLRYDIDPIVAVVATIMLIMTLLGVIGFLLYSMRKRSGRPHL